MEFYALDIETANPDFSSICQIGIAYFKNGGVDNEWVTLVNPEAEFHPMNKNVHGIEAVHVKDSPTFREIAETLRNKLSGAIVVTHTAFDRAALRQACGRAQIPEIECRWLDSSRVARRAWDEFSKSGYGLKNVCAKIGYEFTHHNALEDAKAAGHVLIAASQKSDLDLEGWFACLARRKQTSKWSKQNVTREGNPDGALFGETIVFTGTLGIPRVEAANIASELGCVVGQSVTRKTTILCVGDQDIALLAGHEKSSKHRKAEDLIEKGQELRIIRQTDFESMVGLDDQK
jgi:DNA polymerase III subunit epsilon